MKDKEIMESINNDWCENEETMGEQAALHVACEMNGKSVDWFYDHIHLIATNQKLETNSADKENQKNLNLEFIKTAASL